MRYSFRQSLCNAGPRPPKPLQWRTSSAEALAQADFPDCKYRRNWIKKNSNIRPGILFRLVNPIRFMGIFKQIAEYLYIKKGDPNESNSQWMKYMHGINRISIFMFLAALIIIFVRLIFFRRH
jgi:hypothetical protein